MARRHRGWVALLLGLLLFAAGCGEKAAAPVDMQALWEQMQQEAELPPMRALSEKRMRDRYGIEAADCPQVLMLQAEEALRVDEIWLVEAAGEEQAKELCATAEKHIEQLKKETKDYLPEQYAVLRSARVLRQGTQMALLISPEAEALARIFEGAVR